MTLEDLVPPMKLCKQIPEGNFADSALVWRGTNHLWWNYYTMPRECGNCRDLDPSEIVIPAPTLPEIMQAIDLSGGYCPTCYYQSNTWQMDYETESDPPDTAYQEDRDNPATAALKLWLELERGEE